MTEPEVVRTRTGVLVPDNDPEQINASRRAMLRELARSRAAIRRAQSEGRTDFISSAAVDVITEELERAARLLEFIEQPARTLAEMIAPEWDTPELPAAGSHVVGTDGRAWLTDSGRDGPPPLPVAEHVAALCVAPNAPNAAHPAHAPFFGRAGAMVAV